MAVAAAAVGESEMRVMVHIHHFATAIISVFT